MGKVTIFLDLRLWRAFRVACVTRGTTASKELRHFIETQLAAWQHQTQKESDHV